jgi:peptide deformylase
MSKLNLITIPNDVLRTKSSPVEKVDHYIKRLVEGMFNIMYSENGIGLACIQVGIPKKIFIVDISASVDKEDAKEVLEAKPYAFINPTLRAYSKKAYVMEEGCLSIPDTRVPVLRPSEVYIDYLDIEGKKQTKYLTGLLARVALHEYDHLFGRLIIDFLPYSEQEFIIAKAQNPLA